MKTLPKPLPISLREYERQQRLFGKPLHELTNAELFAASRDCFRATARGILKSVEAVREMAPSNFWILG